MKNDSSSLRPVAFTEQPTAIRRSPLRFSFVALCIANALSGCAALSSPEKFNLEIPANTSEFRHRLYAGAATGSSRLSPDTRGTAFSVDSSSDMGTQLRLGYDVHNMLAIELDTTVLGASKLREQNTDVRYSAATISALVYGWSGVQMRSRREGLSAYGRFGYSALKKSSSVIALEESGTVPILGIGAEYGFVNGLGVRSEITRYDSDAIYFGFGAIYRFGLSPAGIGRMIADAAEPALASSSTKVVSSDGALDYGTVVERYAGPNARPSNGSAPHLHYTSGAEPDSSYVGTMAQRWRPAMRADDSDRDGVLDNVDSCRDTGSHITVDRYGCGLFDAVLHEVTFKSGSRWLTPRARAQLDLLAQTLLVFPEARIQVRAHTDSQGAADMNLGLSSRRAEVVVQYLQSRGVHELQLQAVGMGEAQPLDSNKTRKGRLRNRRIDIVTLPDQDAGQLLVAANVESGVVMSVQNTDKPNTGLQGTLVVDDQWNSAPRYSKGKANTGKELSVPGLLAAKPVTADEHANVKLLAQTANAQRVKVAQDVAPLPQPGFAPNFKSQGVLIGVNFPQGESTLSNAAKGALQPLFNELVANPSVSIAIMAHTDNQGSADDNKTLSTRRAESVVQYLIDTGVDAIRLKPEGYGELLPLVQNVSDADRARNRRIEVRVMPSVR